MSALTLQPMRAPILYPLAGLVVGLLIARESSFAPLPLAVSALVLCVFAAFVSRRAPVLWGAMFLTACCLAAWAYGTLRLAGEPSPERLAMPIREAALTLQIDRVMVEASPYGEGSGIAHIVEAPETSRVAQGTPIYFRIDLPRDRNFPLIRGQRLQVVGLLETIPKDTPEGSFNAYLRDTGIHFKFQRTSDLRLVSPASSFDRFCHRANQHFQNYLRMGAPAGSELSGIYVAMLLGEKTALSADQKDRFRTTGTMHLFAISGLHIGVVAAVIAQFLFLLRVPRTISPFLGLPLLYLYVEITGAAPSAVRAFLMVTFFWLSIGLARQRSPLAAMAGSAFFVLIVQPAQLWQIGFQLSYLVVFSILLFGLPAYQALSRRYRPFAYLPPDNYRPWQRACIWATDKFMLLFAISVAAWFVSAPLGAGFFGYLAPYAIGVNLLLVNLAALAISTGVLSLGAATLGAGSVSWFINHAAWVTLGMMSFIVDWNLRLPFAVIDCPGFPRLISYASVLAFAVAILLANGTRRYRPFFAIAVGSIIVGLLSGFLLS